MSNSWQKAGDFEKRDVIDLKRDGVGTVTKGIFENKKEHVGDNDSTVYNLIVDGKKVSFWGSAVIDGRFKEVPEGSEVRIVFKGNQPSTIKGHANMNMYDVFFREAGVGSTDEEPEKEEGTDIPF